MWTERCLSLLSASVDARPIDFGKDAVFNHRPHINGGEPMVSSCIHPLLLSWLHPVLSLLLLPPGLLGCIGYRIWAKS